MSSKSLLGLLAAAATVSAHGYVKNIMINGQSQTGYNPTIAPWTAVQDTPGWQNWATDTGFVDANNLQNEDIICHIKSVNAVKSASVEAGGKVQLQWTGWPESHHGPVMDYIADCGGPCEKADKKNLKWVKIQEQGQLELGAGGGTAGRWATDILFDTDFVWDITIPTSLKAGNYVLRHELLGLHGAFNEGEAQFYPQCVSLEVTGGGNAQPQGIVGTELYHSKDAGILYSIYADQDKPQYIIPGPALWKGEDAPAPAPEPQPEEPDPECNNTPKWKKKRDALRSRNNRN